MNQPQLGHFSINIAENIKKTESLLEEKITVLTNRVLALAAFQERESQLIKSMK